MKKVIAIASVAIFAISCNSDGWNDKQEKAFKDKCSEGFIKGFEKSGNKADKEKVDTFCSCALDKAKEDKKTFDDVTKMKAEDLNKYYEPCAEEVFDQ